MYMQSLGTTYSPYICVYVCVQLTTRSHNSIAAESTSSKSRGTKSTERRQNLATPTASVQIPKSNTVKSKPSPSPMTMQTRRSSLRSSMSAEVVPMSKPRSKMSAKIKPSFGSPSKPDTGALSCSSVRRPVVSTLAQHVRQLVKFWSSKSTAVDAAAVMMMSQPGCADVIDALLQVQMSVYYHIQTLLLLTLFLSSDEYRISFECNMLLHHCLNSHVIYILRSTLWAPSFPWAVKYPLSISWVECERCLKQALVSLHLTLLGYVSCYLACHFGFCNLVGV